MERDHTRQVVITGFGAVTPVGNDRETTWQNLVAGNSGVGPITAFDPSGLAVRIAAEVRGFDPAQYLDRKRLLVGLMCIFAACNLASALAPSIGFLVSPLHSRPA